MSIRRGKKAAGEDTDRENRQIEAIFNLTSRSIPHKREEQPLFRLFYHRLKVRFQEMKVLKVTPENVHIYNNLAQAYEAEFSPITGKFPNQDGLFSLDTPIDDTHIGYLGYDGDRVVGFANIGVKPANCFEVCEYYILPVYRKKKVGTILIHAIWSQYGGKWEVKQIAGAEYATVFWQKAIGLYNDTVFEESQYTDPYWGKVTRQVFEIS